MRVVIGAYGLALEDWVSGSFLITACHCAQSSGSLSRVARTLASWDQAAARTISIGLRLALGIIGADAQERAANYMVHVVEPSPMFNRADSAFRPSVAIHGFETQMTFPVDLRY